MAAVTQVIPNYIGGVSSQPDERKLPGQVTEATNVYIDPTFGLTKRQGLQFLTTLDTYTDVQDPLMMHHGLLSHVMMTKHISDAVTVRWWY